MPPLSDVTHRSAVVSGRLSGAANLKTNDSTLREFAPLSFVIRYIFDANVDTDWTVLDAEFSGPILRADGSLGQRQGRTRFFGFDRPGVPAWVNDFVREHQPVGHAGEQPDDDGPSADQERAWTEYEDGLRS